MTGTGASTGEGQGDGGRAVPYACPFCAEEDLRPVPAGALPDLTRGGWHCRSCLRVFSLTWHGIHPAEFSTPGAPAPVHSTGRH